jgi:hypothetical protein
MIGVAQAVLVEQFPELGIILIEKVFLTDTQPGRVENIFAEIPNVEHKIFQVTSGTLTLTENTNAAHV